MEVRRQQEQTGEMHWILSYCIRPPEVAENGFWKKSQNNM